MPGHAVIFDEDFDDSQLDATRTKTPCQRPQQDLEEEWQVCIQSVRARGQVQ